MSSYVKISYKTKNMNTALKECIMYIGKYYGNSNTDLYKAGKAFLAKKVRGASKTSVHHMVYPKRIKNSEMKQWCFKKCSYDRIYMYIIYIMLQETEHKEEGLNLLHKLYLELRKSNSNISKTLSDSLVLEQKKALSFAVDKPQYMSCQKTIEKILKCYKKCDDKYVLF